MASTLGTAMLLVAASSAQAEEWVALRPPARGSFDPPQILIDVSSITLLDSGLRRATTKTEWFGLDDSGKQQPNALRFMLMLETYDCAKGLKHSESNVATLADGTVIPYDVSANPKWYPRAIPKADPAFDFVCNWQPRQAP